MEKQLVDSLVLLPLLIIAVTQMVKMKFTEISGFATIAVALGVGVVLALVDQFIGSTDISIAEGIYASLLAIGITAVAAKAGGGAKGDETVVRR